MNRLLALAIIYLALPLGVIYSQSEDKLTEKVEQPAFQEITAEQYKFMKGEAQAKTKEKPEFQSNMPITEMSFEAEEFNFGTVMEGEKIQNVFEFTNTGTEPLIIINAKGSCGCTVPKFPKEPILPGETAHLLVQFDSKNKGKVGGAKNSKRVTITANTEPANTYLTIKGLVDKVEDVKVELPKTTDFDIDAYAVEVFPNPTSDLINLNIKEFSGKSAEVEIYNMTGQMLTKKSIDKISRDNIQFDIAGFEAGTYVISLGINGMNRIAKQFFVK